MIIRPANASDLSQVAFLWVDLIREEFGKNASPDPNLWLDMFSQEMVNNKHFTMLVAENGDGIIGYISGKVYPEPSDSKVHGVSQSIYVKPQYRRGMVGLHLYHNLAKTFVEQGAEVIGFICKPEKIPYWNKKGYSCGVAIMSMNARNLSKAYGVE